MAQKNNIHNLSSLTKEKKHVLNYEKRIITEREKKPVPTTELLKILEDVHKQLAGFDLEIVCLNSLKQLTSDLCTPGLFSHTNLNVKLLVACSIANILRLNAPNPPYSKKQLSDVLWFMAKLLGNFSKKNPYYNYYTNLIEFLSTVKIILLVSDLNDDDLIINFLINSYFVVNQKPAKNCYLCIVDILQQLISGCGCIPNTAIELIISKFEVKTQKKEPESFNLSKSICVPGSDNVQAYFSQYFGNIILKVEHLSENQSKELEKLDSLHKLIIEINKHVPRSLTLTATVLREELDFNLLQLRLFAVETLGSMVESADYNLAKVHPDAWTDWLARKNDVSIQVRCLIINWCIKIIHNHLELSEDIENLIKDKILDPEEKVRIEALKFIESISSEILNIISIDILKMCGERFKDKKVAVREKAFEILSKIYLVKYNEMKLLNLNNNMFLRYSWIPGEMLEALYLGDAKIKSCVEKKLVENIFLMKDSVEQKAEKFIDVFSQLNDRQINAFSTLLKTQIKSANVSRGFFFMCLEYMSNESDNLKTRVDAAIEYFSSKFPNPKYMSHTLSKIMASKDKRIIQMFLDALDPRVTQSMLLSLIDKIINHLMNHNMRTDVFLLFSYSNLPLIMNSDIVSVFIKNVLISGSQAKRNNVNLQLLQKILMMIAESSPEYFIRNIDNLCEAIETDEGTPFVRHYIHLLSRASISAKAQGIKCNIKFKKGTLLKILSAKNCSYQTSKEVISITSHIADSASILNSITDVIQTIINTEKILPISYLGAINRLALLYPTIYSNSETICSYIENIVEGLETPGKSKFEYNDIEDIPVAYRCKMYALKTLANHARGAVHHNFDNKSVILDNVFTVIRRTMDMKNVHDQSNSIICFAKMIAAKSLLDLYKLSQVYEAKFVPSDMINFTSIVQQSVYATRSKFIEKIFKGIMSQSIPFDFTALLMFIAHDPEESLKQKVVFFFENSIKNYKNLMENIFPLLLYLISNQPDFSNDSNNLDYFSEYIKFYLRLTENKENIHHLYQIAKKLKILSPIHGNCSNLYIVSDLAKAIIEKDAKFLNLELYIITTHRNLPFSAKYFKPLPPQEAHNNNNDTHILADYLQHLSSSHVSTTGANSLKKKNLFKKRTLNDEFYNINIDSEKNHSGSVDLPSNDIHDNASTEINESYRITRSETHKNPSLIVKPQEDIIQNRKRTKTVGM